MTTKEVLTEAKIDEIADGIARMATDRADDWVEGSVCWKELDRIDPEGAEDVLDVIRYGLADDMRSELVDRIRDAIEARQGEGEGAK